MTRETVSIETLRRLTGISTPIFGVSWQPSESERSIAKRIVTVLEDQRLLLRFHEILVRDLHYIEKALYGLRDVLTEELSGLEGDNPLEQCLRAMRRSCRTCLDRIQGSSSSLYRDFDAVDGNTCELVKTVALALGELRAAIGFRLAQLCVGYGIEPEEELLLIFPEGGNAVPEGSAE